MLPTLIIGQGLAGTALAWQLWHLKRPFLIVDPFEADSSSRVAAGLITPITGLRLTLNWRMGELLPYAEQFYRRIENELGLAFYHPIQMHRLFSENREIDFLQRRMQDDHYNTWFKDLTVKAPDAISNPLGGFTQQHSAWVDTQLYLDQSREFFQKRHCFKQAQVHPNELQYKTHTVHYDDNAYQYAIFCRGWKEQHHPEFSYLDYTPARGVIAELKANFATPYFWNCKGWILPQASGIYRAGSTYEFDLQRDVTASMNELEQKLKQLLKIPFILQNPRIGIRPIIRRSNGTISASIQHKNCYIFNGLGSKGTVKSPLLAYWLSQHLFHGASLDPAIDTVHSPQ